MNTETLTNIREQLQKELKPARFEHTLGVQYTAACLGMVYDVDLEQCELAGLLHDCAKNLSEQEMIDGLVRAGSPPSEETLMSSPVMHAQYGAILAREKYGITDPEVLSAIRWHTTGKAAMSMLEKIIFIADFIEPLRNKAGCLPENRKLAFSNIDQAVCTVLDDTLKFLNARGLPVESHTLEAYRYYSELTQNKGKR